MSTVHQKRVKLLQEKMRRDGVDFTLISVSSDLFYLTGYTTHISERLHMLVVPATDQPILLVPQFEASTVEHLGQWLEIEGWTEEDDPIALLSKIVWREKSSGDLHLAVGDDTRARFLLPLQARGLPAGFSLASELLAPMRRVKDEEELLLLKSVQDLASQALNELLTRRFAGRTELQLARDLQRICEDLGFEQGFGAQVGAGPNGAMPHVSPGDHEIQDGEAIVIDFWGTRGGYFSDCTRTVHVGQPDAKVREIHEIVRQANEAALVAARPGVECQEVDRAARAVIDAAGYGQYFTHRLGHGLGIDIHEPPYMVEGNTLRLEPGMVFTIEPGIYLRGRFGCRIEDVAAVTETAAFRLTDFPHQLRVVA